MDPADIIAHAASLTESDLAAILVAKCPNAINGRRLECVSLYARSDESFSIDMFAGNECVASELSIESAVARLTARLTAIPTEKQKADKMRQRAAELLAEANALDPIRTLTAILEEGPQEIV